MHVARIKCQIDWCRLSDESILIHRVATIVLYVQKVISVMWVLLKLLSVRDLCA